VVRCLALPRGAQWLKERGGTSKGSDPWAGAQFQTQSGVYRVRIGARNEAALAALAALARGGGTVGMLYGVLHMPDMVEALEPLGYRRAPGPSGHRSGADDAWYVAWRVPAAASAAATARLAAALALLVAGCSVDWWDALSALARDLDCIRFGAAEVVSLAHLPGPAFPAVSRR